MIPVDTRCSRCNTPFVAGLKKRDDPIVLTPCCGWVGAGTPPPWARVYIARRLHTTR